jgi:excisionase family DNA binding protein
MFLNIKEIGIVSIEINGQIYYRTSEACKKTGVSRATLFRWLKAGILEEYYKDRRGWRIFREEDLNKIRAEARKIKVEYSYLGGKSDKSQYA